MTTPLLGIPELTEGQAVPETTVNEMARKLEAGAYGPFPVEDDDLLTPASLTPSDGQVYLIRGTGSGDWTGHDNSIALYLSTDWVYYAIKEGMAFWIKDENKFLIATSATTFTEFTGGNPTESLIVAVSDETTAITTGTAKVTFRMPYAFTLSAVRASLSTAQTGSGAGGIVTVDVNEAGSTILSTKLTIDNGEKTSTSAATPPVISDSSLADDAEMTIDIDQVGDGTAKGLKVYLIGTRT
jgi:hypothetical protein